MALIASMKSGVLSGVVQGPRTIFSVWGYPTGGGLYTHGKFIQAASICFWLES